MHSRNSQSKVSIKISDLLVVDILVAEFRESVEAAIPQIIGLLDSSKWKVRKEGVDIFSKLSEQGKYQNF